MIKTLYDPNDAAGILNLGRQLHQESQFKDTGFDEAKCRMILGGTLALPEKLFLAYDDSFNGLLILQMGMEFFNDQKWAGDQAFYVTPSARGSGLARDLLAAGEEWAKANGAAELIVFHNAGIGLDKAEQYYTKLGFRLSGSIFNKSLVSN